MPVWCLGDLEAVLGRSASLHVGEVHREGPRGDCRLLPPAGDCQLLPPAGVNLPPTSEPLGDTKRNVQSPDMPLTARCACLGFGGAAPGYCVKGEGTVLVLVRSLLL